MKTVGKKVWLVLLALVLIFATAACSGSNEPAAGGDTNTNSGNNSGDAKKDPVTLKLLSHYTAQNK